MTYKTEEMDTLTSYSGELACAFAKGHEDIKAISLNSSAQGSTAIVEFKGMLYRVEIIPTFRKITMMKPVKPDLQVIFNSLNAGSEVSCDDCPYFTMDNPDLDDEPESWSAKCTPEDYGSCPQAAIRFEDDMEQYERDLEDYNL